jgi:hypothetical protein
MASDVVVPGEDLERASERLSRMLQHIDTTRGPADLGSVVGGPVSDAADHFEGRWSDGRTQLHREGEKIREAIQKVMDAFVDTDNQAGDSLGSGS